MVSLILTIGVIMFMSLVMFLALSTTPVCTPDQLDQVDDICMEVTDDIQIPQCVIEAKVMWCK